MKHTNLCCNCLRLSLALSGILAYSMAAANDFPLTASVMLGKEQIKVSGPADFDIATTLQLALAIPLGNNLSAVVGLRDMREAEDTGADDVSDYAVYISSKDLTAALRFSQQWQHNSYYLQAGLSYSDIDMRVEEYYFAQRPSLQDEQNDKVTGGFVSLGAYLPLSQYWLLHTDISWQRRNDVFSGSSKPFDIDSYAISLGVAYSF